MLFLDPDGWALFPGVPLAGRRSLHWFPVPLPVPVPCSFLPSPPVAAWSEEANCPTGPNRKSA